MNKDKAIQLLERLQDPEPYEPMLTKDAYDAIRMAIDALSANGDTISRKAAIDVIDSFNVFESRSDQIKLEQMIGELPPVQPEIIRCKDCKHWIPYDWMFSEVWQSRNINDYPEDEIGCNYCDTAMKANDFCSRGERREVTECQIGLKEQ